MSSGFIRHSAQPSRTTLFHSSAASSSSSTLQSFSSTPNVNSIARALLAASLLPNSSPFHLLPVDIIERIYLSLRTSWKRLLLLQTGDAVVGPLREGSLLGQRFHSDDVSARITLAGIAFLSRAGRSLRSRAHLTVAFPLYSQLQCHMLPFVSHDNSTIPPEFHSYIPLIDRCRKLALLQQHTSQVWYLTVHESIVSSSWKRPGVHVHAGFYPCRKTSKMQWCDFGKGKTAFNQGIYHAANVAAAFRMWNVQIPHQQSAVLAVGSNVEHVRGVLNKVVTPTEPKAGEIYWMADATPFEYLPLQKDTCVQYFKLVTGPLKEWCSRHCTPNRLGIEPLCHVSNHCNEQGNHVGCEFFAS